jgi:hypothetical protein
MVGLRHRQSRVSVSGSRQAGSAGEDQLRCCGTDERWHASCLAIAGLVRLLFLVRSFLKQQKSRGGMP